MQFVRAISRRLLWLSLFAASALPASAVGRPLVDPCRAFAFYTQKDGDWKAAFQATLATYQAQAGPAGGAGGTDTLVDSLLDCYSLREQQGPAPAIQPQNAYEAMIAPLHSFPTARTVVDAGLGYSDLEDLKKAFPALEDFLATVGPIGKSYVEHADGAVWAWLDALAAHYPPARYERDRKRWRETFRRHFEAAGGTQNPGRAFQKAFQASMRELEGTLEGVRLSLDAAVTPELRLALNRKDVFRSILIDGLLARELLQASWETFAESSAAIALHPNPVTAWTNWLKALQDTAMRIQEQLREHPTEVTNPVLEKVRALHAANPKFPGASLVQMHNDQLSGEEQLVYHALVLKRAALNSVLPVTSTAIRSLLHPNFSEATTLAQVLRVLRTYSALAQDKSFEAARRALYPARAETEILSAIEFSPYAIDRDLHGIALAEAVLQELSQLESVEDRRQNAEAFRRVIATLTASVGPELPDAGVESLARAFAAARGAKPQIDFFGSDDFFSGQYQAVKAALGYRKADLFRKTYRQTLLGDCRGIYRAWRILWLAWEF